MLYPIFVIILSFFYLKFHPRPIKDRMLSSLFLVVFILLYFFGAIVVELFAQRLGDFKGIGKSEIKRIYVVSTFSLFALLFGMNVRLPQNSKIFHEFRYVKQIKIFSFFIALSSIVAYVSINGFVLFKSGVYDNRYLSNIGFGMITLLFPFGLVYLNCKYFLVKKKAVVLYVAFIYAVLIFLAKGGQRQIGFAAFFNFVLLLYIEDRLSLKRIFLYGILGAFTINIIALFRYFETFDGIEFSQLYTLVAYFFFDGIIPVDAFYYIVEYVDINGGPGLSIVRNQFSTLVPRFLWESKPEIVLNAGNFYTMVILGRERFITYSPTFLGELYLIGGGYACVIGSFLAGVVLKFLDNIIKFKMGIVMIYVVSFSFLIIFNLYREGLFVLLTTVLSFSVYFIPVYIFIKLLPYKR